MVLLDLPRDAEARVVAIDWAALSPGEDKRLRNFGMDEGVMVAALNRAPLGGPTAYRIGRTILALRASTARAIEVATDA